jgi:hypothetical protein
MKRAFERCLSIFVGSFFAISPALAAGVAPPPVAPASTPYQGAHSQTAAKMPLKVEWFSNPRGKSDHWLDFCAYLANNPHLIRRDYLSCFLGKDNLQNWANYGGHTSWQIDPDLAFEIDEAASHRQAVFRMRMRPSYNLKRSDVLSVWGTPHSRHFNQQAEPQDLYHLQNGCTVAVTEPHNTFAVTELEIHTSLHGNAFSGPSFAEWEMAKQVRIARARMLFRQGRVDQGMVLLDSHIAQFPDDLGAKLAKAHIMFKMHEVSQSADLYKEIRNKANMSGNYTARAEAETALASMGFPL